MGKNLAKRNFNSSNGAPIKVRFAKSLVESAVSRAMADFMINNLTLTTFMQKLQMNNKCCSPEETMLATLNAADEINTPGGFTHWCLDKHKIEVSSISRYSLLGRDTKVLRIFRLPPQSYQKCTSVINFL
jgi:hypothetical protein